MSEWSQSPASPRGTECPVSGSSTLVFERGWIVDALVIAQHNFLCIFRLRSSLAGGAIRRCATGEFCVCKGLLSPAGAGGNCGMQCHGIG